MYLFYYNLFRQIWYFTARIRHKRSRFSARDQYLLEKISRSSRLSQNFSHWFTVSVWIFLLAAVEFGHAVAIPVDLNYLVPVFIEKGRLIGFYWISGYFIAVLVAELRIGVFIVTVDLLDSYLQVSRSCIGIRMICLSEKSSLFQTLYVFKGNIDL